MPTSELLIPVKRCVRGRGVFRWPRRPILASPRTADLLPLRQLAEDLRRRLRITARVEQNAFGPAAVRIRRDPKPGGAEAYRMSIAPGGIEISACADAGAYYAVQTLRELLAAHGRSMPACAIEDTPDFARRGVYHDCSRGKVPRLQTLKALAERLAHWKINELQLYVENVFRWKRHPAIGRGYSPLTPQEILALQDHCKQHHVRLVGSLASFGHMERILALPQYSHLGEMPGFRGRPGGSTLCPGDPGSIRLVEELYEEFVPLLEAEDFNICGDETWELGQGRSKARAARVGVGRVYLAFLLKLRKLCERHGKRMNAWADIVLKHPEILQEVPKDIVMLNWDYSPQGKRIPRTHEITDAGLPVVVCPGTNAWNSHGCRLKMGMLNIANFAAEGLRRKAEGLLNTDWGDGGHRNMLAVSLHNLAWGAAHSWNHRHVRERGFTERFCRDTFRGAEGRLAGSIRTLGGANETLRQPYANSIILYRAFLGPVERFLDPGSAQVRVLDELKAANISNHAAALSKLRWPSPAEAGDRFGANALAEYALATQIDLVACRRAALLKQLRSGGTPPASQLKTLAESTAALMPKLKRVWALNNKPSRLRYMLQGIRSAIREYGKLARR